MKCAMTTLTLLVAVTAAAAAPTLTFTRTDLGGGLAAFDFAISNNDGLLASYILTLSFQADPGSTINQVFGGFGFPDPDTESQWLSSPFYGPAAMAGDTWIYSPFGDNLNYVHKSTGFFEFSAGGTGGDGAKVLHLVAGGLQSGAWTGTIARSSVMYPTSGAYPEPATMALLGAGALGLLRRRK